MFCFFSIFFLSLAYHVFSRRDFINENWVTHFGGAFSMGRHARRLLKQSNCELVLQQNTVVRSLFISNVD